MDPKSIAHGSFLLLLQCLNPEVQPVDALLASFVHHCIAIVLFAETLSYIIAFTPKVIKLQQSLTDTEAILDALSESQEALLQKAAKPEMQDEVADCMQPKLCSISDMQKKMSFCEL